MATHSKTKKAAKTRGRTQATRKKPAESAPRAETAPTQPEDSQGLVVFAFRLTRAERDLIHKAAGAAKASQLVKGAALAAATKDVDAFRAIITEAEAAKK